MVEGPATCDCCRGLAVNFRLCRQAKDYKCTKGILFANRNEGQRAHFSETIRGDKAAQTVMKLRRSSEKKKELPQYFIGGLKKMADVFNLVMLVCAAVGAMAFGVLTAYGIFRVGFALMRPRAQRMPLKIRTQLAGD